MNLIGGEKPGGFDTDVIIGAGVGSRLDQTVTGEA